MARRTGFKNIQIQGKAELSDLFDETYEQSGANSKAEFLNILLDEYLNPQVENKNTSKELVFKNEELEKSNQAFEQELAAVNEELSVANARLALYENDILKQLLDKHQGKTLKFRNPQGEPVHITVNDLPDVFKAVINSIQV